MAGVLISKRASGALIRAVAHLFSLAWYVKGFPFFGRIGFRHRSHVYRRDQAIFEVKRFYFTAKLSERVRFVRTERMDTVYFFLFNLQRIQVNGLRESLNNMLREIIPQGIAIGVNKERNLGSFELHPRDNLPQVRGDCYL